MGEVSVQCIRLDTIRTCRVKFNALDYGTQAKSIGHNTVEPLMLLTLAKDPFLLTATTTEPINAFKTILAMRLSFSHINTFRLVVLRLHLEKENSKVIIGECITLSLYENKSI